MSIKARMFTCCALALVGAILSFIDIPFVPWQAFVAVTLILLGMTIYYLSRTIEEKPIDQTSTQNPNAFGSKQRMSSVIGIILGAYATALVLPVLQWLTGATLGFEPDLMISLTTATVVAGFIWLRLRKI